METTKNNNNDTITTETRTSFDKNGEQRTLILHIAYNDVPRTTLMEKAAKYDKIQFQRALRTSFVDEQSFHEFHDNNTEWNVHSEQCGHKIVTPEQQRAEIERMINTLPEPQRSEMIKRMNNENDDE